jgi:uncharacterized OsmC-like protein
MKNHAIGIVKQRQDPLRDRYRVAPEEAWIIDGARSVQNGSVDSFHSVVTPGEGYDAQWRVGIHRAVGGYHDLPNPGDVLCAALASCLDSTLRMIADRLEVPIRLLEVTAHAEIDVRGTLLVDRSVPVGFQQMKCSVRLEPEASASPEKVELLLATAEHSCVVLQTLRSGVPVQIRLDQGHSSASVAAE